MQNVLLEASMAIIFSPEGAWVLVSGNTSCLRPCVTYAQAVRLVIAGPPDDDQYRVRLEQYVARYNLADRVEFRFGFRPRHEIAQLMNEALACVYLPIDEDSLGYVSMEAFCAAKPVLTSQDAGGLLEIVHNDQTGFVAAPRCTHNCASHR